MNSTPQSAAPAHTVDSIADAELLRRVVRNLVRNRPRREPCAWAVVSSAFGLGSTFSAQLCRRVGLDPDTGAELKALESIVSGDNPGKD
jgi:hypothetical protein